MGKRLALGVIVVAVALLVGVCVSAWGQEQIKIVVNGREVTSDVPPQIINGRTMVPLRAVAEALGADVRWDENNSAVEIFRSDAEISGCKLTLNDYLLIWDNTYSELGRIQNVARNLSISATQGLVDNIKASETMFLLNGQVGQLFEQLSCLSPPTEAIALHRETLKELVLWSTGYRLSAKGLANLGRGEFYNVKPFADEAYEQSSVVWGLRKAITQ